MEREIVVWCWGHTIRMEWRPGRRCRVVRGGWDYGVYSEKAIERCGMMPGGLGRRADPFHVLWGVEGAGIQWETVCASRVYEGECMF